MYRTDGATAATSLPTPESALTGGFFTEGNATSGTPATNVRASWLNVIQEELRAVVVAGGLTPSKTTYNQVLDAIKALVPGSALGRLLSLRVFKASGTYTPTVGTGTVVVEVQGAGAGTANTASSGALLGGAGRKGIVLSFHRGAGYRAASGMPLTSTSRPMPKIELLKQLKQYRVAVNRVDVTQASPAWPAPHAAAA
jgi:hypothetical protein